MRTERVDTNQSCNQNCTYCNARRPRDDAAFVRRSAVQARFADAVGRGAHELVLTGGEPTLRSDLPQLVEDAWSAGAGAVALETNAALIDDARARALANAKLSRVRVNLSGWGPALDEVTRDPGGFEASRRGLHALLRGGLAVEIGLTLVRSTVPLAHDLPTKLAADLEAQGLPLPVLLVLTVPVESPDPTESLASADAVPAILDVERAARGVGIPVKLAPSSAPPPCVFPSPRPAHLFSLGPGATRREDHEQLPVCSQCQVREQCSGLSLAYRAAHGLPTMEPITDDRVRRRLTVISTVQEQIAREFVTPNRLEHPTLGPIDEDVIRVNFHCNQVCRFCFVSTHLPPAGDDAVREAITAAARRNVKITLSGGEPTLNPRLVEYVALARSLTRMPIQLQTNATRLDDASLVDALVSAGLDEAFVSLHGSTAAISDAITGAPGTFARSVIGIDHLAKTNIELVLNFVICESNHRDLPAYVQLVAERWPRAFVNISFVAPSTDVVPREREFIPRYSDVLPYVATAVEHARARGLSIGGFESMCGIPLCLVPASTDHFFKLSSIPPGFDRGEFMKAAACESCALGTKCYGVRRGYAAMHGDDELRPVAVPSAG